MEYEVKNFIYNGFYVEFKKGKAKYKAKFVEWTPDPGIAKCACTDDKERLIPCCQLVGFKLDDYPKQEKTGVLFGVASKS